MSGNFYDANYNVTKIRTNNGEVAELELNGKPVALASDVDLEDNKEVTIDVSAYTEPVEITPTSGKDGMKKATVTLSNIPSPGGVSTLYCWSDGDNFCYTVTETPTTSNKALYANEMNLSLSLANITEVTEKGIITDQFEGILARLSLNDISLT